MAKTNTKGSSRSEAIRVYMRKNRGATVGQIVDAMRAEGLSVTPGLVYNVQAGLRKKRGAARAKRKANAAASINGAGTTKADAIRDVAKGMTKPVRPVAVRVALAAKGIDVSGAQISTVLKSMGMRKRRRRRKRATAGAARATTSSALSIDDLVAAKKLVGQVGSIEKVKEALGALARLG